jgi:lysophospholipid acyltransferase (LPLAT)-like uncharacterized protein
VSRSASPDAERRRANRIAWIGTLVLRLLASTWRIRFVHDEAVRGLRARGVPFIFVLWHGELLPLLYVHRGRGIAALISEHADGELIARVVERLGYRTVRGSTSRGAARALIGLERAARDGCTLAITPDGPRGPALSFAPGAMIVAQRSGLPLVAVSVHASRAWRLRSWDRFMIPKPFARLQVAYSEPLYVPATSTREAAAGSEQGRALLELSESRAHG